MDMSVLHKRVDTRITIAILSLEVFAALLSLVLIVYPNMNVKASSTITASSIIVVFRNDPGIQNSSATSQLLGSPKVVTKFSSINNLNKKYNTQSFRQMFVQVQYFNTVYELVVNTTDVSITVQDFKKDLNVEYARISEPNFEQKIKNEIDTTNQNIVKQNLHWTAGYTVPEIMTDQDRMKLVGAILPAGLSLQTSENSNQTKAFLAGISGCVPVCFGKKCGDPDGCGGFCQTCPSGQVCTGTGCCTLNCSGRTCGGDGCGGSCGSCAPGQVCYENMGGSRNCCTPNCSGKICGDNGCGGSCGQCSVGNICNSYGQCVIQRSPLPSTFDWRNINGRNYITPVKDQHYCGSCAVFATIGSLEGEVNAYYNNPSINLDLSEQDLVSCSGAGSCSTGFSVTLPYIRSIGVTDEACFPYTSKDSSCSEKCSTWQSNVWKINSFMIDDNRPNLIPYDTIKERVFQQGPITTYMGVYNSFHGYTGGIYEPTTEEELTGKHVVVIIGYGVDSNNRTYWICKNSWGTWWGEGDPNDPICNANPLDPRCKKGYFRIYAGAASAIGYYAESIISPNPPKPQQTICEDKDNDGYCYWGFADQPPATGTLCPKQCKMDNTWKYIKDCDDSNNSFGPFVSGNSLNCQLLHYPADTNNDYKISQAELDDYSSRWKSGMVDIYGYAITTSQVTRAGVFFKAGGYKLQAGTIDGFAPITSS